MFDVTLTTEQLDAITDIHYQHGLPELRLEAVVNRPQMVAVWIEDRCILVNHRGQRSDWA